MKTSSSNGKKDGTIFNNHVVTFFFHRHFMVWHEVYMEHKMIESTFSLSLNYAKNLFAPSITTYIFLKTIITKSTKWIECHVLPWGDSLLLLGIQLYFVCQSSKSGNVAVENILHLLDFGWWHGIKVSILEGRSQACTERTSDSLPNTRNIFIPVLNLASMCSLEWCA